MLSRSFAGFLACVVTTLAQTLSAEIGRAGLPTRASRRCRTIPRMYRWLTGSVVALAAPAALAIGVAAPAAADNQSYLDAISTFNSPTGTDGLLKVGKGACSLLRPNNALMFGRSPNVVAQMVWEQNPQLERDEATQIVNAAIDNLCPGVNPFGYAS